MDRILIAEPNDQIRRRIVEVMSNCGYKTAWADCREMLYAAVMRVPFHVVLMSNQILKNSPEEMASLIRRIRHLQPETRVVLINISAISAIDETICADIEGVLERPRILDDPMQFVQPEAVVQC